MKITHNTKTGKTTITLHHLETRQILGSAAQTVGEAIKHGVENAVDWATSSAPHRLRKTL